MATKNKKEKTDILLERREFRELTMGPQNHPFRSTVYEIFTSLTARSRPIAIAFNALVVAMHVFLRIQSRAVMLTFVEK